MSIGGNITGVFQVKDEGTLNKICERGHQWEDRFSIKGWLDLSDGTSNHTNFNAKIQESTHIFLCDYLDLGTVTSENSRMVIDGMVYETLLIDDPMQMHEHLEIYLRFVGGQK